MTVAGAVKMVEAKKKRGVHKAAERAVARVQAVDKRADAGVGEQLGGDYVGGDGNRPAFRELGRTASADPGEVMAKRSRKRPRTQGDDTNGPRKRLQVKSAEFIEDSDDSTSAGPSLQMQGTSSCRNIVPQHPRLSVDSGTAVGTPFEYAAKVPLPDASTSVAFSPAFTPFAPVLPTHPNAPVAAPFNQQDPFPMFEEAQIQNWDATSFPILDPSLLQGPDFEELVERYRATNNWVA